MNKLITFRNSVLAGMLCLVAASCSDVTDNDILPDGKYPMTFTAAVDGMAVSRAVTANGTTSWEVNDLVAISKNGGTSHKAYKITDAANGAMSPNDVADALYWNQTTETLGAWHPVSCTIGNGGGSDEVDIIDQSGGFGELENILYAPAANYTYSSGGPVTFTFRHALAKVSVTLRKESGKNDFTDEEIFGAEVTFMGYTAGSLGYEGLAGDGENGEIKPKKETADGTTTYTALLVPQQMQNVKFIKVTIGAGAAARDYYYTPAGDNDANLTAGKQYTYNITVKKEGLQVESVSASWDGETSEEEAVGATFKVHLADFTAPANTSDYKITNANGEVLTAANGVYSASDEINISLSANENYRLKTFLTSVDAGICKQKIDYVADTRTYTYTFYDIRSDLWLDEIQAEVMNAITYSEPQVGDYYYSDGTWSTVKDNGKSCIGIVFKVGSAGDDNLMNYGRFFAGEAIHGYVVALQDALSTAGNWGKRGVETPINNVDNSNVTAYTGYSDTKTIISTYSGGSTWNDYQAFKAVVDYRSSVSAPSASSDWYLPSLAQLGDVYNALSTISSPLTTVGDAFQRENDGRYWTSSEKTNSGLDAWYITMGNGSKTSYAKDGTNYSRACYVRAILTF